MFPFKNTKRGIKNQKKFGVVFILIGAFVLILPLFLDIINIISVIGLLISIIGLIYLLGAYFE